MIRETSSLAATRALSPEPRAGRAAGLGMRCVVGSLGLLVFLALLTLALGCGEQVDGESSSDALTRLGVPPTDLIANYLAHSGRAAAEVDAGLTPPGEAEAAPEVRIDPAPAQKPTPSETWLDLESSHGALVSAGVVTAKADTSPPRHWMDFNALGPDAAGTQMPEGRAEILFDKESDTVKPAYYAALERVAQRLRDQPKAKVVLEGHSDSWGSVEYNQRLSLRRAEAVAKLLTDRHGVETSRIQATGVGEARPATTNDSPEGRAQNRRVVAVFEEP